MPRFATVLLVAGTIALTSCGGSDSDDADTSNTTTSATPSEVTRASYIAEADAFCKKTNAEAKRLNERSQRAVEGKTTDDARLAALEPILKEGYVVQQEKAKAFDAIPSPPADQATVAKLKAAYDEQTTLVGQLRDAAVARDVEQAATIIAKQNRVTARGRSIAKSYGFKECGSGNNEAG